jgi:predicted dienelactone hydrolase
VPYPLVIVSHGYPGNRLLMSHLGENLASKGYVVASIDHPDSTYADQQAFGSTLYNRPLDQLFVLNEMSRLGAPASGGLLAGLVDASRTLVIGYSMGGYGVINLVGGAYREAAAALPAAPANGLLRERTAANPAYRASIDPRVKAAVAIGPWGMQAGYWDAAGLAGIRTPILFVAGSVDDVSGYERGTRAIFDGAVNADRYLLTFVNANHNAAAPIPAPVETYTFSERLKTFPFTHYADAVWDTVRMNNILQHFVTAFADLHLKGMTERRAYFDVTPNGRDGVIALTADGAPQPTHTYWKGFKRGTAAGLVLEHRAPATAAAP